MIRYFTAGESHGPALSAIVEGMPAGVTINPEEINAQLARRQQGHGRGGRMKIETDKAEVLSGIRFGKTIGSPISLVIKNRDWENWTSTMAQFDKPDEQITKISIPRPGHADLAGRIKYGFDDIRPVIERSSARETAARVAAGALSKLFLKALGIEIGSYISAIGPAAEPSPDTQLAELLSKGAEAVAKQADLSPVRMLEKTTEEAALAAIDAAKERGDTLGGIIEIFITGVPPGFGSYVQHDRRLDAALAAAVISIQAIKGVEIGNAFDNARKPGSQVHDEFHLTQENGLLRKTNRAGGLEGSMSSGQIIHLRAAMKPISSLVTPLR
ncbi:MAG: chorismate synthase, partial [Chlorobiales bacterium]|nr:chorismate synthase [Chlorobiales bacterium]